MTYPCICETCQYDITPYLERKGSIFKKHQRKAGVFFYDSIKDRVLLVQSRGNLWGCPKGTLHEDERPSEGAAREVYEETGLKLSPSNLKSPYYPTPNASYFYIDLPGGCSPIVQKHEGNDANAVAWISLTCLKALVRNQKIQLTYHTKKLLEWIVGWCIK